MGFSFRKSFKIAPGIKLNVSKSGLGISGGVKGARVSVGPRGARLYGGVGPVRFQQSLSQNETSERNAPSLPNPASEIDKNKNKEKQKRVARRIFASMPWILWTELGYLSDHILMGFLVGFFFSIPLFGIVIWWEKRKSKKEKPIPS